MAVISHVLEVRAIPLHGYTEQGAPPSYPLLPARAELQTSSLESLSFVILLVIVASAVLVGVRRF